MEYSEPHEIFNNRLLILCKWMASSKIITSEKVVRL